mmetsp:Transcript_75313/g.140431  ORF Transcript_75313/g.140431 Transcript_75313/m.140431 type:complete len:282 (-) Transcript_75313:12-857(-)
MFGRVHLEPVVVMRVRKMQANALSISTMCAKEKYILPRLSSLSAKWFLLASHAASTITGMVSRAVLAWTRRVRSNNSGSISTSHTTGRIPPRGPSSWYASVLATRSTRAKVDPSQRTEVNPANGDVSSSSCPVLNTADTSSINRSIAWKDKRLSAVTSMGHSALIASQASSSSLLPLGEDVSPRMRSQAPREKNAANIRTSGPQCFRNHLQHCIELKVPTDLSISKRRMATATITPMTVSIRPSEGDAEAETTDESMARVQDLPAAGEYRSTIVEIIRRRA